MLETVDKVWEGPGEEITRRGKLIKQSSHLSQHAYRPKAWRNQGYHKAKSLNGTRPVALILVLLKAVVALHCASKLES